MEIKWNQEESERKRKQEASIENVWVGVRGAYSTVGQSVNTCIPIYIDWMLAAENDIDLNK